MYVLSFHPGVIPIMDMISSFFIKLSVALKTPRPVADARPLIPPRNNGLPVMHPMLLMLVAPKSGENHMNQYLNFGP